MNDIKISMEVWDKLISLSPPRNITNRPFSLRARLEFTDKKNLVSNLDGLFSGDSLDLVFKKNGVEKVSLKIDITNKLVINQNQEEVGQIQEVDNGINLNIQSDWVLHTLFPLLGLAEFSVIVEGTANNKKVSSNEEYSELKFPLTLDERETDAVERGAEALEGMQNRGLNVRLDRSVIPAADEQQRLFILLKNRRPQFLKRTIRKAGQPKVIPGFFEFMNDVLEGSPASAGNIKKYYTNQGERDYAEEGKIFRERDGLTWDRRLDFPLVDSYEVLKFGAEAFLRAGSPFPPSNNKVPLPYYDVILQKLEQDCVGKLEEENMNSAYRIPSIELIWSYWMEQGMLVQTMNAISLRYQNISNHQGNDPLARLDINPLRPLNNLLWGYIQDEQHSLSVRRRAYEYDHSYGLMLQGRAVPTFKSADSRSKFLEAFHNLLHSSAIYFRERDDATRFADAFPLLNALREVHMLLAEGNHNSYGNLTWTARIEMMVQQYILARPEMREFLGGRAMVPFQEPWMDRVDSMRQLQNWGSTSITYYHDLAELGELIILSIRLTNWEDNSIQPNVAAVWADGFRNEIQRYIHSYRTVTGVDLSADAQLTEVSFMQPSVLIQRRLQSDQRGPLRNSRIVGVNY